MSDIREQLEFKADRIEAVLSSHRIQARVTGGTVTPRWIRFQVLPTVGAKISKAKGLNEELAAALDAPSCRVSRRGAAVDVEVPRDDPLPVQLMPLYRQLSEGDDGIAGIPPVTAILGLAEDGAPLLIRLPSPDVAHILVAGTTGSGKTALMQTMILSLAMANPAPSPFQMGRMGASRAAGGLRLMLIDPKGYAFGVFQGLPHLARDVIQEVDEAAEALQSLVHLMERQGSADSYCGNGPALDGHPHIVVVIDEMADLLMAGGNEIQRALTRLTQRGREAGIHVVAATRKPSAEILGPLIGQTGADCANFPVRLVGRVASASDARTATGWSDTGAEHLMGRGDFLAVAEGRVIRFQAAYVSAEEIREAVAFLAHNEAMTPSVPVSWTRPLAQLAATFGEEVRR
jgi:S-DNA-T family DNA segregation ATPase FtsK/SpoIIIE